MMSFTGEIPPAVQNEIELTSYINELEKDLKKSKLLNVVLSGSVALVIGGYILK